METTQQKSNFFSDHADTFAIIGVNLAGLAILVSMWLSHAHRMDAANARIDTLHVLIYDMIKEKK